MTEDSAVWLDDHQQRVWRLWLEVSTTLPAVLNRQLSRDSQLSVQDFEVLVRLSETDGGDMRVVALAEHMGWERSRLSHHLTRMEKRGLIERRVCCSDGRGAIIHLTDQGTAALQQAAPGHAALVRRVVLAGLITATSTTSKLFSREFARVLLKKTRPTPQTTVEGTSRRRVMSRLVPPRETVTFARPYQLYHQPHRRR